MSAAPNNRVRLTDQGKDSQAKQKRVRNDSFAIIVD